MIFFQLKALYGGSHIAEDSFVKRCIDFDFLFFPLYYRLFGRWCNLGGWDGGYVGWAFPIFGRQRLEVLRDGGFFGRWLFRLRREKKRPSNKYDKG